MYACVWSEDTFRNGFLPSTFLRQALTVPCSSVTANLAHGLPGNSLVSVILIVAGGVGITEAHPTTFSIFCGP